MNDAKHSDFYIQPLITRRDHLNAEMEALRNKIEGLEIAIKLISEGAVQPAATNGRKVRMSETIVSLLRDSGETGLKPKAAIELAARIGINLKRGSVYSLLNRMERAGVILREDAGYKLREFARQKPAATVDGGAVSAVQHKHQI